MKRFTLMILLAVVSQATGYAQISGHVVDEGQRGIDGVVITLLEPADSTFVATAVGDEEGRFAFDAGVTEREYLVRAERFGYMPALTKYEGKALEIVLKSYANDLNEVTVVAQKPGTLRASGNKFVYVPDALPGEVRNAFHILCITPLVEVSPQGALSLIGKGGCRLYVNGRPPRQGEEMFKHLLLMSSPDKIKKVELIMNPDFSEGTSFAGGIINLIMDEPDWGWMAMTSARSTYNLLNNVTADASVTGSYTYDKISLAAGGGYGFRRNNDRTLADYFYMGEDDYTISNDNRLKGNGQSVWGNISFGYKPTDKSEVGIRGAIDWNKADSYSIAKELDSRYGSQSVYTNVSNTDNKPSFGTLAYYYLETDGRGSNLDINIGGNLGNYGHTMDEHFSEDAVFEASEIRPKTAAAKAKYMQKFADGSTFKAGADWLYQHVDHRRMRGDVLDEFLYRKSQSSIYASYEREWTRNFGMMVALALENHHIDGDQTTMSMKFKRNDWDLVPRVSLSYSLPEAQQNFLLSYTSYVHCPSYPELNPFRQWTSSTTYTCGNPNLKIQKGHILSLSYSALDHWYLDGSLRYTPDTYSRYTYEDGEGNTAYTYANLGTDKGAAVVVKYYTKIKDFIRLSANVNVWYNNQKAIIDNRNMGYSAWGGRTDQDIKFIWEKGGMEFNINNMLHAPDRGVTSNNKKWYDYTDLSITKNFGYVGSLSLYVSNIFNIKRDSHYWSPTYGYNSHSFSPGTMMMLSFNYRFGNLKARGNRADRYSVPTM